MSELICEEKTVIKVDISDLTSYLSEKMGRRVEYGETNNDTDYEVEVDSDGWEEDTIATFRSDGYLNMNYGYTDVLNWACDQGWLKPGTYLINVSW